MKIAYLLLCFLSLFTSPLISHPLPQTIPPYCPSNAITYSLSGGRLGDNLLAYLHARWLAYKYDLHLIYTPFNFSDQFALDLMDHRRFSFSYKQYITIQGESDIQKNNSGTLYTVPYFPESLFEYEMLNDKTLPYYIVDWEDPAFKAEVIACLAPLHPVETLELPQDQITVGVHVRRGGGAKVDTIEMKKKFPLKFPTDDYYIEQIRMIAEQFPEKNLYIYILTDDPNPKSILKDFQKAFDNPLLHFDCRQTGNGHQINILEDFLSIPKFDCLVISQSNFSLVASKLGDFAIIAMPTHAEREGKKLIIDEVDVKLNSHHKAFAR